MTIEQLLADVKTALDNNTAALKAFAGNLEVGGAAPAAGSSTATPKPGKPAPGDAEGTRYFDIAKNKTAVRVAPGETAPSIEGTVEITGAQFVKLDKKYKEEGAKNVQTSQTGAAGGQTQASGTTASGDGPSFQDVTAKITELAKKPVDQGGGRGEVVKLLEKWGVKTFPEAQGKKPNAELIADIEAALNPQAPAAEDDLAGLGL